MRPSLMDKCPVGITACLASYVSFPGEFEGSKDCVSEGAYTEGLISMELHSRELPWM